MPTPLRLLATLALALVCVPVAGASADVRVAIFYYPWYGTPARDGSWQHWDQRAAVPPAGIASEFYPARGVYSSSDSLVVGAQMGEIRAAGVDQVVVSWWGRESPEDQRLSLVLAHARARRLDVAVHVEPYAGRTPASVADDARMLRERGVRDIYLYRPEDAAADAWATALAPVDGVRVLAQTPLVGLAAQARFDGIYTYDVLVHGAGKFGRICDQARRARLLCAPSVGPGYDARRATGDPRVKPRRSGRTYDTMWRAALAAGADRVTITSYNEWHEGTQIEPARAHVGPAGEPYLGYEGAWGARGRAAERAYLRRTAYWSARFGPR